tara:strand:- start:114 stop:764 length:651 start_codon:yes stop_codon:yes gene_type:complete
LSFSKKISRPIYSCNVPFHKLLNFINQIESDLPDGSSLSIRTTLKDGSSNTFHSSTEFAVSEEIKNFGIASVEIYYHTDFSVQLGDKYSYVEYKSSSTLGHSTVNFAIDTLSLNKGSWFTKFNQTFFGYSFYWVLAMISIIYNSTKYGLSIYTILNIAFSCSLFYFIFISFDRNRKVKIIMKNDTDNFLIRKKEDLATNAFFTLIGLIFGYFIGKL